MKAVILDGALNGDSRLSPVREVLVDELAALGWQVEPFALRELDIRHCAGCFGCWVQTPGVCLIDDAARDIARSVIRSELVVYLTPVTFGGYSSELKKVLDRLICLVLPFFTKIDGEVHHQPRYDSYPRLLGLGLLSRPDDEAARIFATLVARNAINLHAPVHAAGVVDERQGAAELRREIQELLKAVEVGA